MSNSTDGRAGRTAYWITTAASAVAFAIPGAANLARVPHIASDMAHLGYPPYFLTLLGTWKLLAAIAILAPRFPRLKEWAYAGMLFDLTGAAFSRAMMHDGPAMVAVPLLVGTVVVASWALRPASRRWPALPDVPVRRM
ncbi:MAG TPA: DoxX family protein [Lacunisphaera sp.]|jgi:uncharacterized membrane protein YphA (DoxX/SURF4 family)|nr:DoxX family protein [Lacunisphaera sp.]